MRVLLVEDDARIRQALGLALSDEGFEVVEVGSGEEALDLVDPDLDVVLLDLMLPGVDGTEVCSTLRSRGDLPIIIATDARHYLSGRPSHEAAPRATILDAAWSCP